MMLFSFNSFVLLVKLVQLSLVFIKGNLTWLDFIQDSGLQLYLMSCAVWSAITATLLVRNWSVCIVTRCIVDALQHARMLYDESLAKLTILTDATNQKISLTKHLAKECRLEVTVFPILIPCIWWNCML